VSGLAGFIRASHIAASLFPAGFCLFVIAVLRPASAAVPPPEALIADLRRWLVRATRWTLPVAAFTGVLWLGEQAVSMSGRPVMAALTPDVLGAVLGSTFFGRLWVLRAAILAALAAWALRARAHEDGPAGDLIGLALSGAFALTLAWVGHAAGEPGQAGMALLTAQVVHLLATAGWLGALPALAWLLVAVRRAPASLGFAAAVIQRFSPLGMVYVAALVLSGTVNSWFLVGSVAALIGTVYGQVLMLKLALFAAMLVLAAINRWRLLPGLDLKPKHFAPNFVRSVTLETVLGFWVLLLVGMLSGLPPGAHDEPVWPLPFSLSANALGADGQPQLWFVLALVAICLGLTAAVFGALFHRRMVATFAVTATLSAAAVIVYETVTPAFPTSFMYSPIGFTAEAVARGAELYGAHCAECHGAAAQGEGGASDAEAPPRVNLVAHLAERTDGDLFWWIGNGIPDTRMPGFAADFPPNDRWRIIRFLRAQADVVRAGLFMNMLMPQASAPAPEFTVEIGGRSVSLRADQGQANVLVVFYDWPSSRARLEQLAAARRELSARGLRLIAIPRGRMAPADIAPGASEFLARPAPEVEAAYRLYDPRAIAGHVEFLIDRPGDIRARWSPEDGVGWSDIAALELQLRDLNAEPFRPAEPVSHVHS
jgi:putative copper export protein